MSDQSDKEKMEKLEKKVELLREQVHSKKRKALNGRISRATKRLKKLLAEEGDEAKEKNAPAVEELRKNLTEMRDERKKVFSESDPAQRKRLRRLQRQIIEKRYNALPPDEKQKELQKLSDVIGKRSMELSKTVTKGQVNAFDHSLRKKVKSFTHRLKKLGRLAAKAKAKAPAPETPAAEEEKKS